VPLLRRYNHRVTLPALEAIGLGKVYGDLRATADVTFSLAPGEILGLVGPNGAGKTTTLRCLAGIIPPTQGIIRVGGIDLAADPVGAKRQLAFLPDEPKLFDYLTVREHLNLVARLYQVSDWEERAKVLIGELELTGKENSVPSELSRGMRQKLLIACGFLHDPKVILLDEPLTGLDPLGIRRMKQSLRSRSESGAALLLSSHLLPLVEEICHRVMIIAQGRIVAMGTLDEIRGLRGQATASLEELFVQITSTSAEPAKGAA